MKYLETKSFITISICAIVIIKMFIFSVSIGESMAVLFILLAVQAARIIDYKFPERPDIDINKLNDQIEELERDVTALKFGNIRK